MSLRSIRQWLLGIEDRPYGVSTKSYPARIEIRNGKIVFSLNGHTLIELERSRVKEWTAKDLIEEFDKTLSAKFGLNKLAWEYGEVDAMLQDN